MRDQAKVVLGLLLLFLIVSGSALAQEEPIVIEFGVWGGTPGIWEEVAKAFNAQSESIKVEIFPMGVAWPELPEWLIARIAVNEAPDIAFISPINYRDMYENGLIMDMSPYMKRDPLYDPDAFWPAVLDWIEVGGKVYAFPSGMVSYITYYNKQLFAEAGLEPLALKHTQDDLFQISRKLTQGEDRKGLGLLNGLERIFPWVWANGGDMFSEDGTRALFDQPVWLDTVSKLVEMVHAYEAAVPDAIAPPWEWYWEGKVGVFPDGTWGYKSHFERLGNDVGVAPLAEGSAGYHAPLWPDSYVIPTGTENPEAAWKVIRWFATEGSRILLFPPDGTTGIPVERSVTQEFVEATFSDPNAVATYMQNAQLGTIPNYPSNYLNIMREADVIFAQIFRGEIPPAAGLEQLQQRAEVLLKQNPYDK